MKAALLSFLLCTPVLVAAQVPDSIAIKQVDSLIQVSRALTGQGDFDKALEVNAVAEKIALEGFKRESAAYGSCCFNRGRILKIKGDFIEAEKWYLQSKAIREKALGKAHPDYAFNLNNLALLYLETGNYEKAEPLLIEAISVLEKAVGKEHPGYAVCLNSLATLYWSMDNYEKAGPLYLEALAIREKVLGKEHPDYAQSLANLANLYLRTGNYEKAELLYLEALTIREKVLGKEHPEYALNLNNLANLYTGMGNHKKAETYFHEAIAITEKELGKEHPNHAICLYNLANLYVDIGNYEKAGQLQLEVRAIREKTLGKEHPDYAMTLNSIAFLYQITGNYEKAEPLLIEAKTIQKKALGKEHPDYAMTLHYLGRLYMSTGNDEKAESLLIETKSIREKVMGKEHPDYALTLNDLSKLYEKQKRFNESERLLEEATDLNQTRLGKAATFLSEQELAVYATTFHRDGSALANYAIARSANQAGSLPSLCYDHALFYKGFLLVAASHINTLAAASLETNELNSQLNGFRRHLSKEYAKPVAERDPATVAGLESKANTTEKELAKKVAGYASATKQVRWKEVQAHLKKEEAAIEFVSFQVSFLQKSDSTMYAALLLLQGTKQPKFILLFEEKQLDSLLQSRAIGIERKADYVNGLYTIAGRGAKPLGKPQKSLYELLWQPLEKELAGVQTVYFSPSGLLHRLNLGAVPISEEETLADRYRLVELGSTRQLVIPLKMKTVNQDAYLFGGIQYEMDSTAISQANVGFNTETLVSRGELSFSYADSTNRGGTWSYLKWTEKEVAVLEPILKSSSIQTTVRKGFAATEESFKSIGKGSPSPRILHIATHGFFFPDPKEAVSSRQSAVGSEPVFKISDHPMIRSGLILAGGNHAWKTGKPLHPDMEDGILTAYEISQMNLAATELVVLSACETGLGDIQGNEGVYGLQRAFKIAGAKYLVMSLWQVPDFQTQELMTTFYSKWLTEKMSIPDAFRSAQQEMREKYQNPYFWAGFVLVE